MGLELSKTEWEETFRHENHLAGSQSCAQRSTDFPDPTFGVQCIARKQVSAYQSQTPTGPRQSLKVQTYVAKALWDLLLQGVKAKDICIPFRVF